MILMILIALFAAISAGFLAVALLPEPESSPRARLQKLEGHPVSGTVSASKATDIRFTTRVVTPALRSLWRIAERIGLAGDTRVVQAKLDMAGRPKLFSLTIGVREYVALKLVCYALAGVGLVLMLRNPFLEGPLGTALTGLLALVIGMLPTLVVDHLADARKTRILRSMSDTLDLLVVSAEAGLSLDAAMSRVGQQQRGPLADEFETALQEMRLGKSRADAWRGIAARSGVPEIKMFTSAIIQAESLGVSIAQVLRTQAETHRERRCQRLRETAAKLPVKMLVPMIAFILPSIFVVLAAPGLMMVLEALGPAQ